MCSKMFLVKNGVRQGGIISPILFCVYIDGMLQRVYESGVGWYIGKVFVGALAYADDVVLLAPTHSAMRRMLRACEDFAKDFCVIFNFTKSMCMLVFKSSLWRDALETVINSRKLSDAQANPSTQRKRYLSPI